MILYHGSNIEVRNPHLLKIQRDLDFGKGFYTTSNFQQALLWAKRSAKIRGSGTACVNCYEFDEAALAEINVLRFNKADSR